MRNWDVRIHISRIPMLPACLAHTLRRLISSELAAAQMKGQYYMEDRLSHIKKKYLFGS